jgi:hypothetical protein
MADTALKTLALAFTENCECIENHKFDYPALYDENDPAQYVVETSKKVEAYLIEVLKHVNPTPDPVVSKPCYKKEHTTGLVLLKSFKKHKRTLVALRQVLHSSKEKESKEVSVQNGKKISAIDYTRMYESFCTSNISLIRSYRSAHSKISTRGLLASLKTHEGSLKVLKHLLEDVDSQQPTSIENVDHQLEVVSPPPI